MNIDEWNMVEKNLPASIPVVKKIYCITLAQVVIIYYLSTKFIQY